MVHKTMYLHCLEPIIDGCDCSEPFKDRSNTTTYKTHNKTPIQEINPQLTRLSQWTSGTPVKSNVDFIRRDFRRRRHHRCIRSNYPYRRNLSALFDNY